MRFKGLDLNLLTALDVLLTERSVTRAAERLNLSQPAVSSALSRLRDYFRDELLVPTGRTMIPTGYAQGLHPLVQAVLGDVERLVAASAKFDPATATRQFRLVGSDYILATLVAPAMAQLQKEAPHVRFRFALPTTTSVLELERGEIDLLLTPRHFISPHHPAELLFEEPHVVAGWAGNPVLADSLTLDTFLQSPHVSVEIGPAGTLPFAEEQMKALGLVRRIEVVAPSFATVPWMLPHTTRLAVMHDRLARAFAQTLPLKICPLPFPMPTMHEMAQFHSMRDTDEALKWLVRKLRDLAESGD